MFHATQPPGFLKVIADEVRWQLLSALSTSDYRVQELVGMLAQPQNLVSYHLKRLKELHIVNERRSNADARDVYYSLDFDQLRSLYVATGEALHPSLVFPVENQTGKELQGGQVRILLLCTENSARSQMAEALLRQMGGAHIIVLSAGTKPAGVHPLAVRLMAAMNIDISGQRSKHIDEFQGESFDYVVTVCDRAREVCPKFPNTTHLIHWSLPDPVMIEDPAIQYEAFEQVAQQLVSRIRHLLMLINYKKEV
jgi:protein-tyrosine-phosphatase